VSPEPEGAGEQRGLTLLVRAYCHLCDEMREVVAPIAAAAGIALREVDVDGDPALDARWGDRVPVLLGGERELCHYRLDAQALAAFLADATA
jgi:thioredoxin reductase (NADPH)